MFLLTLRIVEMAAGRQSVLREAYLNERVSPVAFAAPRVVLAYLRSENPSYKFTLSEIKRFEKKYVLANQLLRNAKENLDKGPPTKAYGLDDLWQASLFISFTI